MDDLAADAYRKLAANPRYRDCDLHIPEGDYPELRTMLESPSLRQLVRWRLAAMRE